MKKNVSTKNIKHEISFFFKEHNRYFNRKQPTDETKRTTLQQTLISA